MNACKPQWSKEGVRQKSSTIMWKKSYGIMGYTCKSVYFLLIMTVFYLILSYLIWSYLISSYLSPERINTLAGMQLIFFFFTCKIMRLSKSQQCNHLNIALFSLTLNCWAKSLLGKWFTDWNLARKLSFEM